MPATVVFIKDIASCTHCRVTDAAMRTVRPQYADVKAAQYDAGQFPDWETMRADIVSHFRLHRPQDVDFVSNINFVPVILLIRDGVIVETLVGAKSVPELHDVFARARAS